MSEHDMTNEKQGTIAGIISSGILSTSQALSVTLHLVKFIDNLHSQGFIHRQICEETVQLDNMFIVTLEPIKQEVTIGGIGVDRIALPPQLNNIAPMSLPSEISAAQDALTKAGILLDPRQIDFYQIGALLCYMVSGQDISSYLRSCKAKADVPEAVRPIIDRALGLNSKNCFCSSVAFAAAIEAAVEGDKNQISLPKSIFVGQPARADINSKLPFEKLGHYEIIEHIGHGGMGDVYKGYDKALERFAAIKVLPAELARQKDFVKRFHAEAAAIAKLDHPNIVRIYYSGQDRDHHFFAMQYVDGQSLADLLKDRSKLSTQEALPIIKQALAGIGAAHKNHLIHRDIKPGNILLDRHCRRALITDFGVVKSAHTSTQITVTGAIMGTADYIAPEQARGADVDGRADLYAMGVLMYQTLSGRLPFDAKSATSMMFQHAYETPPALSEIEPDVPEKLAQIVMKLMSKDPDDRYSSADDVLMALQNVDFKNAKSKITPQTDCYEEDCYIPQELSDNISMLMGKNFFGRLRNRIADFFGNHAQHIIECMQTTTGQLDSVVAQYQQQRDKLAALADEAQKAAGQLQAQANQSRNAAELANQKVESAQNSEAKQQALQEQQQCQQSAAELAQLAAEQSQQAEEINLRLSKVNANLLKLRSQHQALKARMNAAKAWNKTNQSNAKRYLSRNLINAVILVSLLCFAGLFVFVTIPVRVTPKNISNQPTIIPITFVTINDPGFNGQMSKYETTNAQYAKYLNEALASGDIKVDGNLVECAKTSNTGKNFVGQTYYKLDGKGTAKNIVNSRIKYNSKSFIVENGFENHPVTFVSWYGATAFCNYYGWQLPSDKEWMAAADYDGSYKYGCGPNINHRLANYDSKYPYGTAKVGEFGEYGYGLADMAGNVREWTSTVSGKDRVVHGGSWTNFNYICLISRKLTYSANGMYDRQGFRVCKPALLSPEPVPAQAILPVTFITIDDPNFKGQMSKYETTYGQYAKFLNEALASGNIVVDGNLVKGANVSINGKDFTGQPYYNLEGKGEIINGTIVKSRIHYDGKRFVVENGFENHSASFVSWYGAKAFSSYYGWNLPYARQWQAAAASKAGKQLVDMEAGRTEWTISRTIGGNYIRCGGHNGDPIKDRRISITRAGLPHWTIPYHGFRVCQLNDKKSSGTVYIVSFAAKEPLVIPTAKELLDTFNNRHSLGTVTHHFRTEIKDGKLIGHICVDDEDSQADLIGLLANNDKLIWIGTRVLNQQEFEQYCQLGQPSLPQTTQTLPSKNKFAAHGSLVAWGNNSKGQCNVPDGDDYVAITAGNQFNVALKEDGSLVAWGDNTHGQCNVPSGNDFVKIDAGSMHAIALRKDGSLAAWGNNSHGECNVPSGTGYIDVAAGGFISLAINKLGKIEGWGANWNGVTLKGIPQDSNYVEISSGWYHSLARKKDGTIVGWGYNNYGQSVAPNGANYIVVSANGYHSLALRSDGSILAWGDGAGKQSDVPANQTFIAVQSGAWHSLALRNDGSLAAWGTNTYNQCVVPSGNNFVAIAAGENHNLAIINRPNQQTDSTLPIAHWKFDEGKGDVAHDSAGKNHGTIHGATWVNENLKIFANSVDDFSSIQGKNNWYYGYYDGDSKFPFSNGPDGDDFEQMQNYCKGENAPFNSGDVWNYRFGDGGTFTCVGQKFMHPEGNGQWAVRRWISNHEGIIIVEGQLSKFQESFAGDGVTGHILLDGKEVWFDSVEGNDVLGKRYSLRLLVKKGSVLDFAIDPGKQNNSWDDHASFTSIIKEELPDNSKYNALDFDGQDDYIDCRNETKLDLNITGFTLGAWVKLNKKSVNKWLIAKGQWLNDQIGDYWLNLDPDTGNFNFGIVSSEGLQRSANYIYSTGQWYHLIGIFDGSSLSLYVNGQLIGSPVAVKGTINRNDHPLQIGGDLNHHTNINGTIDDVRIYNRSLSKEEVCQLYQSQATNYQKQIIAPGPIAHWKFDEGKGNIAHDMAGKNHGTIHGATWVKSDFGQALEFDGIDDYVTCGNDPSLDLVEFTWSFWMKRTETEYSDERSLISTNNPDHTDGTFGLQIDTGGNWLNKIQFVRHGDPEYACLWSEKTIADTSWHFVTATRNKSGEAEIYIDGNSQVKGHIEARTAFKELLIGAGGKYYSNFKGILDDIQIYNRALNQSEIQQLYQSQADIYN